MTFNPLFANQAAVKQESAQEPLSTKPAFKALIIDDETEVHRVTELTLKRFRFEDQKVQFLHAYSGQEAFEVFTEHDDIAVALVDVVMENDHAGLDLVKRVRQELNNNLTRLILRTGQPGQAPEHEVIEKYDINDYKEKTELTSQKLKTLMYSGLRSYRDLKTIEEHRKGLRQVIESTSKMLKPNALGEFASAVLKEIMNILQLDSSAIYCSSVVGNTEFNGTVLAATGSLADTLNVEKVTAMPDKVRTYFEDAFQQKKSIYFDDGYVFYTKTESGYENLLFVDTKGDLSEQQRELLEIYCINVALTYENLLINEEIKDTQRELVYLLGDAVEMRSKETGAHVKRVSLVCYKIAQALGLDEEQALNIKRASPLHDLGKVAIPDAILHKPAKLDADEWALMQTHASVGYDILNKSTKPLMKLAAEISLTHHEKWDGTGYPEGLKGEDIPISGRIAAIADVFDALGSRRAYKEPWGKEEILNVLKEERGRHFQPELVDIIVEDFDGFWAIREQFPD